MSLHRLFNPDESTGGENILGRQGRGCWGVVKGAQSTAGRPEMITQWWLLSTSSFPAFVFTLFFKNSLL